MDEPLCILEQRTVVGRWDWGWTARPESPAGSLRAAGEAQGGVQTAGEASGSLGDRSKKLTADQPSRCAWDAGHWVLKVDGWSPWFEARLSVGQRRWSQRPEERPHAQHGAWPSWAQAAASGKAARRSGSRRSRFCFLLASTTRRNTAPAPGEGGMQDFSVRQDLLSETLTKVCTWGPPAPREALGPT